MCDAMPQNATIELSPSQATALERLLAGATVTDAAAAAGVDRTTVHRWRREANFIAAFNRSRNEQRDAVRDRLAAIGMKALDALERAIEADDTRAALAVVTGLGYLSGEPVPAGPEDPEEVQRGIEAAEVERQIRQAETESNRDYRRLLAGVPAY